MVARLDLGQTFPLADKKALDSVIVYEEKAGVKFTGWERDRKKEKVCSNPGPKREHNSAVFVLP